MLQQGLCDPASECRLQLTIHISALFTTESVCSLQQQNPGLIEEVQTVLSNIISSENVKFPLLTVTIDPDRLFNIRLIFSACTLLLSL